MTIYIAYDNIWARLDTPIDVGVVAHLYEELKCRLDGYEHMYAYKSGKIDGYTRLFNTRDNSFRRGLLDRAISLLEEAGHEVKTKYTGTAQPEIQHRFIDGIVRPYDFQESAVKAGLDNDIGLIVSPTGTGKTVVLAKLIASLKRKTLVIVTDIVLLDQMVQALQRYFDQPIGMVGDGEFNLQDITVSTIQSLLTFAKPPKAIKKANDWKVFSKYAKEVTAILSDEVHLSDTASFSEVMPMFVNADKVLGASATPFGYGEKAEKKSNLEMEQHFGRVIYDSRKLDFIALGLKVPVVVDVITRQPINKEYKMHKKKSRYGTEYDWGKNYRECLEVELLNNPQYHEEVARRAWTLAAEGKSAFVHAAHSIKFGEDICNLIPGAVLINGQSPRLKRREIYDAMRKKDLLTIVSDLGGTGIDIPSLDAMVLATDSKDIRQFIGRVSRKPYQGDKQQGRFIDFRTDCMFLSKHYNIRRSQYEHEGYVVLD